MSFRYLIDANVFIQAKNSHYGFDFCPAFWDWLITQNNNGVIGSLHNVKTELTAMQDELSDWVRGDGKDLFINVDATVTQKFPIVSNWLDEQNYEQAAIYTFAQGADFFLVAYALAHNCTVVTHEKTENRMNKVKIPNVCLGLGVSCVPPYAMLRNEHARFVLQR